MVSNILKVLMIGVVTSSDFPDRHSQEINLQGPSLNLTFGSCYGKTGYESSIFDPIAGSDVFVWLGDASYTDNHISFSKSIINKLTFTKWQPSSHDYTQTRFDDTKLSKSY
jgi:hypothetical protein